jgi:hypothetical protein
VRDDGRLTGTFSATDAKVFNNGNFGALFIQLRQFLPTVRCFHVFRVFSRFSQSHGHS